MANISSYVSSIEGASRGEQVRDAIVAALNAINTTATNSEKLDGHAADYFATASGTHDLFFNGTYFDTTPTQGSSKAVTSGGLYTVFATILDSIGDIGDALDLISGEVV